MRTLREVLEELRKRIAGERGVEVEEVNVRERTHVEKFDGGRADILAGLPPSEYLVMENGKVVYREIRGMPVSPDGAEGGEEG